MAEIETTGPLSGVERIEAERQRQKEYRSLEDDQEHVKDELARAGAWYALPYYLREPLYNHFVPRIWPYNWAFSSGEPARGQTDSVSIEARIRQLVKAGALIAAEIDRLQNGGS